jgi:hypothetical protein
VHIYREEDLRPEEKELADKAAWLVIKDARYLGVDKDYLAAITALFLATGTADSDAATQLPDNTRKVLKDYPDWGEESFNYVAFLALKRTFPCKPQ